MSSAAKKKWSGPAAKRGAVNKVAREKRMTGRMGRSQAVTTFGVGSIYELRTFRQGKATLHSVMVAGLDAWDRFRSDMQVVREDVLKKILGVDYFLAPPVEPDYPSDDSPALPAVRFPGVLYCDRCGRVGRVGQEFTDLQFAGPRCADANCTGRAIPFRFVVACYDKTGADPHPGHIDDFPYEYWAHRGGQRCDMPAVYLTGRPDATGLSGLILKCKSCKAPPQSMESIFGEGALAGLQCRGHRPWLFDREAGCGRPVRVLQRGASNTYFPVTVSALSIPPYSDRLFSLVGKALNQPLIDSIRQGHLPDAAILGLLRNVQGLNNPAVFTNEQVLEAARIVAGVSEISVPAGEAEQRDRERNALVTGRPEIGPEDEFVAVPLASLDGHPLLLGFFDRVVQVHRLREVRALRGFQRVEPNFSGDAFSIAVAPLSKRKLNWLPAMETRGEGIYLELNRERLLGWRSRPEVLARATRIGTNMDQAYQREGRAPPPHPSPTLILVHTVAHLLIKQLGLECGYSSNSLRERLYFAEHEDGSGYAGVLIYTASTSADGTLGGLVGQGDPKRLEPVLRGALQSARWCSSDPLCGESQGQGADALNLAACHACALVAETSCEKRNLFLDRGLVTGTLDNRSAAFFLSVLDKLD
jgi:hypothetical protein